MAYNFIYTINGRTNNSIMYDTKESCYIEQSKFIKSKEIVESINNVQIQSCNDYSNEDGTELSPTYNINANAKTNNNSALDGVDKKLDNIPGVVSYTLLEPINNVKSIGSDDSSFSTYIQSSFNVILGVIIVIGVFRIMYGGTIFLTTDIVMGKMKGKETIINSLRGILLAMTTWSLLYFINPDILKNNVTKIVTEGVSGVVREVGGVVGGGEGSGGLGSRSCDSPAFIIEKINTNQNICSGQTCSKTCNFTPEILSIAKEESLKAGIDYRITLAIACRESSANPSAIGNHANNGYADCGLMQINMKGVGGGNTCTPAILDIHNNISEGIKQYKNKYNNISKSYNNVDKISQAFASYNCCANGDNPNDKSVSCDAGSGFTQNIPKWACPISPGNGSFNMCSVKNYACDVYTCINKY